MTFFYTLLCYISSSIREGKEFNTNSPVMEKPAAPELSKLIRILDSFTRNFSRKTLSFEFIFCLAVQHYDWNPQNEFSLLVIVGVQQNLQIVICISFYVF